MKEYNNPKDEIKKEYTDTLTIRLALGSLVWAFDEDFKSTEIPEKFQTLISTEGRVCGEIPLNPRKMRKEIEKQFNHALDKLLEDYEELWIKNEKRPS